jgi:long-chain acyl-CoA synthetase
MALNPQAITIDKASTLPAVFRARVEASGSEPAYVQHDPDTGQWRTYTWAQTAHQVRRWQAALQAEGLKSGDRVAIMCRNSHAWVVFDQAALGLGLVVVPLYVSDRPDNVCWILADAGVSLLVVENPAQWQALLETSNVPPGLRRVVALEGDDREGILTAAGQWLGDASPALAGTACSPDGLATIVYTSGTTGRPKGVMLSHRNILWNIDAALQRFRVGPGDLLLSFLPLSHTLERTGGYYLPLVAGACVAFNRGVPQLAEDLERVRPTLMISVPRIFERVHGRITGKLATEGVLRRSLFGLAVSAGWAAHEYRQGRRSWSPVIGLHPLLDRLVGTKVRARLGGRLRLTVCGGAALAPPIARFFIGLGIPVVHGYGLTETSPVISVNPLEDNVPETVGPPIPGVEVRIGERGELLTRSPSVMLGYWKNPDATRRMIDADGWLRTGDKAELDAAGRIRITGRLKDIIVLSTGEKVPPADIESAILLDPLFEQVMLVGEGRPHLAALVVPDAERFAELAAGLGLDPADPTTHHDKQVLALMLERLQRRLKTFPGYARVHRLAVCPEPWAPENGFMTPTLKLKRTRILEHYAELVEALYVRDTEQPALATEPAHT